MCDEDLLSLQNILQSVPRRELKIILERAEYIFPPLKDSLVSASVFVRTEKKKSCKIYFWDHFATKLISLLICST
jgi:hypothetical protein